MANVTRVPMAYNNVYLVSEGGERLLIDTGPDYRGAWGELQESLAGRQPGLVVATHAHQDHAGLGREWIALGVPVAIGEADAPFCEHHELTADGEMSTLDAFVQTSGAPPDVTAELRESLRGGRERRARAAAGADYLPPRDGKWPTALRYPPFTPSCTLVDDEDLPAGARALHSPGHTPGNLVVVVPAEGWLFSGDQLLPDITPTPALQWSRGGADAGERFRSLPAFAHALERLRGMSFVRCFPGHGEPFDAVSEAIDANLAQMEQRTERVWEGLCSEGPASLYTICERLYPKAVRRRAWQILATVQGHVDILEEQGRVVVDGGIVVPV